MNMNRVRLEYAKYVCAQIDAMHDDTVRWEMESIPQCFWTKASLNGVVKSNYGAVLLAYWVANDLLPPFEHIPQFFLDRHIPIWNNERTRIFP